MPTLKIQKADGTFEFLQLAGEEFADIGHQVLDVKSQLAHKATKTFVTPEEFSNGSTDQTNALNNAILFARDNNLSVKLMGGKTYRAKNVNLLKNTKIEGNGAIIKLTDDADRNNNDKLLKVKSSDVTIRDLVIDGNIEVVVGSPSFGCDLVYCEGAKNLSLENVTFQNSLYLGLNLIDVDTVHVKGCKFINIDAGIIANSKYCYNAFITNCLFDGHSDSEPITISGDTLNKNIVIIGNEILNKGSGMGIIVGREPRYDVANTSRAFDVVISGNIINGVSNGIQLNNVTSGNVFGNIIKNCGFRGIQVTRIARDISIYNNIIEDVGLSHIDVADVTSGVVKVQHNTFRRPNTSGNANSNYSFLFTGGTTGTATRILELWFENNTLYAGTNGTSITTNFTGTIRLNENEFIPNASEEFSFNYQSVRVIANRNINIFIVGTANATNVINNGTIRGNGTNLGTSLSFWSRQGYDVVYINNTVSSSSNILATIPTQYDGKKLTLIIKKHGSNSCGLNQTGNLRLQEPSYTLTNFTSAIFNFVSFEGNWYEVGKSLTA